MCDPCFLLLLPWVTEPRAGEGSQVLTVEITASASERKKIRNRKQENNGQRS